MEICLKITTLLIAIVFIFRGIEKLIEIYESAKLVSPFERFFYYSYIMIGVLIFISVFLI